MASLSFVYNVASRLGRDPLEVYNWAEKYKLSDKELLSYMKEDLRLVQSSISKNIDINLANSSSSSSDPQKDIPF